MDISVVIPAYNEEKYLERCLKSLQRQQFGGNFEVIVSDDSSTDGTARLAETLADKVITHPKSTISQGRQIGADAAKYEVIAFTDADTFIPPNWLASLASSLEDEQAAGVHGNLMPLDGTRLENHFCRYVLPPYSSLMVKINKPSVPGANFAVKREAFKKVGGFNVRLSTGEDVELCNRIKSIGPIRFNPEAIVYVSTRRIRKWGYMKTVSFHISNTLRLHAFGSGEIEYEPVR